MLRDKSIYTELSMYKLTFLIIDENFKPLNLEIPGKISFYKLKNSI